jgi:hypothetical protein
VTKTVEASPSDNHFMARGYRYTYPGEDPASAKPVQEMKVKSLITYPLEGSHVLPGIVPFAGLAWGGTSGVRLVELSLDNGGKWRPVFLSNETSPTEWRAWSLDMPLDPHQARASWCGRSMRAASSSRSRRGRTRAAMRTTPSTGSRSVWTRRLGSGVLVLAIAAAAAWSAGDGTARRREVYPNQFPAGGGQALAERYCQICHAPSLITQQAKDSTGWEKTLGQMEKWGIQPTPAEHDSLRGYLLSQFGPRAR